MKTHKLWILGHLADLNDYNLNYETIELIFKIL